MSSVDSKFPIRAVEEARSLSALQLDSSHKKRGTTISALMFSSASIIELVMRVVAGVITARIIGPSTLGKFAGAALILGYIPAALGGVTNGLGRDLPFHLGAGQRDVALSLAAVAKAWSIAVGLTCLFGCLVVSARYAAVGEMQLCYAWATNAVTAFFLCYAQQYLYVIYRTTGHFSILSQIKLIQGLVILGGVTAVWEWKFEGLCVRAFCLSLLTGSLLWLWRPLKVRPRWDGKLFVQLLRTGVPIYLAGQLMTLWPTLNSTLIYKGTASRGLGLYAVANIGVAGTMAMFVSFSNVVYPRMTEEYGRSGDRRLALRVSLRPTIALGTVLLTYLVFCIAFLGPVVRFLMPKYIEGVPAAQWAIGASVLFALTPPLNLFAVVKKLLPYAICIACGMAAYAAVVYLHPGERQSLELYPKAMVVGMIVYIATSYMLLIRLVRLPEKAAIMK